MAVATGGTAQVQGELWSARADDWAEVHEHNLRPVYEAALDLVHAGPGVRSSRSAAARARRSDSPPTAAPT